MCLSFAPCCALGRADKTYYAIRTDTSSMRSRLWYAPTRAWGGLHCVVKTLEPPVLSPGG